MPQTIEIGDIRIDRVIEMEAPLFDPLTFFPSLGKERLEANLDWLAPRHYDPKTGKIILCIQSYVVRTKHHTILVDTCVGNDKHRPHRPFWHLQKAKTYEDGLKSVGLGFDDIDFVTCTHLHVDHVGWNTRLENGRWVPTFKNARYLMSKTELDHWTEREKKDASTCPWITDSVLPIVAANKADLVTSKHVLNDIVHFIPTPGHTIDHFSVRVGRKGADAVIAGDMIHSPIQARYPEIGMMSDYDSAQAGRSRRELFGSLCDTSTLMCTGHFASPSTGHVTRWDDGFRIE